MIIFLTLLLLVFITIILYLQLPVFGKAPDKSDLEKFSKLSNYKKGTFQNIHETKMLADGKSMPKVMLKFIFGKKSGIKPHQPIPSMKSDLNNLPIHEHILS